MKKLIILTIFVFGMGAGYAVASSTATNIVMGYLSNSGCAGSQHGCWLPFTSSHPMPVGSY